MVRLNNIGFSLWVFGRVFNLQMNFVLVLSHQGILRFGLMVPRALIKVLVVQTHSQFQRHYARMLTIFIPLLVDESSFFAHFMCFEVPALVPPGGLVNGNKSVLTDAENDDDLGILDIDENYNDGNLHHPLTTFQEDFYAVVDWAYKIDPIHGFLTVQSWKFLCSWMGIPN